MSRRPHLVSVRLSDEELALVDELRPRGSSRPAFFRAFIRKGVSADEIASRDEALAMLTAQARDGKVQSTIALERALRSEAEEAQPEDELERIFSGS